MCRDQSSKQSSYSVSIATIIIIALQCHAHSVSAKAAASRRTTTAGGNGLQAPIPCKKVCVMITRNSSRYIRYRTHRNPQPIAGEAVMATTRSDPAHRIPTRLCLHYMCRASGTVAHRNIRKTMEERVGCGPVWTSDYTSGPPLSGSLSSLTMHPTVPSHLSAHARRAGLEPLRRET